RRRLHQPDLRVQGMRRDLQRIGDILQDVGRGAVQAAFDLAEIWVGDPGQARQLAEGQVCDLTLGSDELAEGFSGLRRPWHVVSLARCLVNQALGGPSVSATWMGIAELGVGSSPRTSRFTRSLTTVG